MNRIGNIWDEITSFENLYNSFYKVLKGKRSFYNANDFFLNLESELFLLQNELINKTYKPGDYRSFWITEPKKRLISAAPFKDRIIHHALIDVLEPYFDKKMIEHSYACRKGKGNHKALKLFAKYSHNYKYVLKMDIKKFFPSIDHEILKDILKKIIKDKNTLDLLEIIIDSSNPQEYVNDYFYGDSLFTPFERKKGIPIGNLTSQFFGNLYLNPMDHFIKENLKAKKYIRYMDDFVIFSNDKEELNCFLIKIKDFLSLYRLKLHQIKTVIRKTNEGIPFLGFIIFPNKIRVHGKNLLMFRKRFKQQKYLLKNEKIMISDILKSFISWESHIKWGDTFNLRIKINKLIKNELFSL